MKPRYVWVSADGGRAKSSEATFEEAIQSALRHAYQRSATSRVTYGADLAFQLWKSLEASGWKITQVRA